MRSKAFRYTQGMYQPDDGQQIHSSHFNQHLGFVMLSVYLMAASWSDATETGRVPGGDMTHQQRSSAATA